MKKFVKLALTFILITTVLVGCGKNSQKTSKFNKDNEIVVVTREEGSGTRGAFVELTGIEEKDSSGNKVDNTTKEAITQMKTDTVLTTVAGNEYSIGYISTGSLNDSIKPLNIDDVEPTTNNIKNGSYKIARPFNIATKERISPLAEDFINFILSKEGQEVVSNSYIEINHTADPFTGVKPEGKIVVAGSSSVTPVMEKLREAYISINSNAEIEIQQSDSSAGMQAAIDGTADIGMASRELKDSEKTELMDIAIALDGIAVIVNKNNDLNNISIDNVKNIFTGNLTNWSDIK